ncbi:MAG TPA: hypothetical protein VMP08_13370 [Anaerolineae bacterium]|nr:hypothetical protein [Anaerolineae bacterium]
MSVADQWFLATAGHCIQNIDEAIKAGYSIAACNLLDSLGLNALHKEPVPFSYENSHPTHLVDDEGFDYGIIPLSEIYRGLLEKNSVKPLNEEVWKKQPAPSNVGFYLLMGIPWDFVAYNPDNVELVTTLHQVEPINERPQGFTKNKIPLFYGRINLMEGMTHLQGLSGGPIFAFCDRDGQMKYWLIALQSKGLPESHYIAACPTYYLGSAIEKILGSYD